MEIGTKQEGDPSSAGFLSSEAGSCLLPQRWRVEAAQVLNNSGKLLCSFYQIHTCVRLGVTCNYVRCHAKIMQVEICLTSNVMTGGAPSLELHHFGWSKYIIWNQRQELSYQNFDILLYWIYAADLYNAKHPLSLCTDDSGLFSTSLSNEYYLVAATFGMSLVVIMKLKWI